MIQTQAKKIDDENSVILHLGSNVTLTEAEIVDFVSDASLGDIFLTQGETNKVPFMLQEAKKRGMMVVFNAAPYPELADSSFSKKFPCDWLFVNRNESCAMLDVHPTNYDAEFALKELQRRTGIPNIVITLGKDGYISLTGDHKQHKPESIPKVSNVEDTTGAGDVFLGYFVVEHLLKGTDISGSFELASVAAALAVQTKGTLNAIPTFNQVNNISKKDNL